MRAGSVSLVLALGLAFATARAQAQPRGRAVAVPAPDARDGGLLSHVGLGVARKLASSDVPEDRRRAVERFVGIGTKGAVLALLEQLEGGTPLGRDPDARLLAVRLLASRAADEAVGRFLERELLSASTMRGESASLLRGTAALALARTPTRKNVEALLVALRQTGPARDAAEKALVAYPPSSLEALLYEVDDEDEDEDDPPRADEDEDDDDDEDRPRAKKADAAKKPGDKKAPKKPREKRRRQLSPKAIEVLGELGDLRAVPALREELTKSQAPRTAAAIALARLGDASPIPVALEWTKNGQPRQREAAVEVLARLDAPQADDAAGKLLEDPATRGRAVDLVTTVFSTARVARLAPRLGKVLPDLDADRAHALLVALARAGDTSLAEKALASEASAARASHALGTSGTDAARAAFGRALAGRATGKARRTIVRGALVHVGRGGAPAEGLVDALGALVTSKDAADRELGAFGLVLVGDRTATSFHDPVRPDPAALAGAVRASLAHGESLAALAPIFGGPDAARVSALRVAAGAALLDPAVRKATPRSALVAWAEEGGALGPVAAFAVGERNDDGLAPRVASLLASADPGVRAATALGLAADPLPGATSRLVRAYESEPDEDVRAACVRALALRAEPQRRRALGFAADLDPSDRVRGIARAALRGTPLPVVDVPRGAVAWIWSVAEPGVTIGGRVRQRGSVALPTVASPDGDLMVVASPAAPIEVDLRRLAAPGED